MRPSLQKRIKGLNNLKRVKKVERFQTDGRVMQKIITGSLCLCFAPAHLGCVFCLMFRLMRGRGFLKRGRIFSERGSLFSGSFFQFIELSLAFSLQMSGESASCRRAFNDSSDTFLS